MNSTQRQSNRLNTLVKASSVDRFRQRLTLADRQGCQCAHKAQETHLSLVSACVGGVRVSLKVDMCY